MTPEDDEDSDAVPTRALPMEPSEPAPVALRAPRVPQGFGVQAPPPRPSVPMSGVAVRPDGPPPPPRRPLSQPPPPPRRAPPGSSPSPTTQRSWVPPRPDGTSAPPTRTSPQVAPPPPSSHRPPSLGAPPLPARSSPSLAPPPPSLRSSPSMAPAPSETTNSLPPPAGASPFELLESELAHTKRVLSRRIAELNRLRQETESASQRSAERDVRIRQLEHELAEARASEALALARLTESRRVGDVQRELESKVAQLQQRLSTQQELAVRLEATERALAERDRRIRELESEIELNQGWAATERPDDLTAIRGIGPKLRDRLHAANVRSYGAIAAWSDADVERMAPLLGVHASRIRRDGWVESAKQLARG